MDKERSTKIKPSELEAEGKRKEQGILARAQNLIDEEIDDVKNMNQMVLYSKVVTIRDKQLEENKILEQKWLDEQKQLDLLMEIERLKKIQYLEEKDAQRVEA